MGRAKGLRLWAMGYGLWGKNRGKEMISIRLLFSLIFDIALLLILNHVLRVSGPEGASIGAIEYLSIQHGKWIIPAIIAGLLIGEKLIRWIMFLGLILFAPEHKRRES